MGVSPILVSFHLGEFSTSVIIWLVVEPTRVKNASQNGNLPQIRMKIKDIWNQHLATYFVEEIDPQWCHEYCHMVI